MDRTASSPDREMIGPLQLLAWLRALAVASLAGALSGAVALGVGSRLAMRVTALQASAADQGRLTDAQATVGEITVGGTVALVLLGAAAGAIGGLLYAAVERRFAWAGRWHGLAFGVLLLAVFGSVLVEASNPDFAGFGVAPVNVAMFGALFVAFGVLVAPVYGDMQRAVPRASQSSTARVLAVPELFGLLLLAPAALLVVGAFLLDNGEQPITGMVLLALMMYVFATAAISLRDGHSVFASLLPLVPPAALGVVLDVRELVVIL